jgi:hypothetical protein
MDEHNRRIAQRLHQVRLDEARMERSGGHYG